MNEVTEPTRKRVEAYEKALGCRRVRQGALQHAWCFTHGRKWDFHYPVGCPMAVAAARVEAERVAEYARDLVTDYERSQEQHKALLAAWRERNALRAVVEQVRRALDDELANLADDGARLSHSVVRRIEAALAEVKR